MDTSKIKTLNRWATVISIMIPAAVLILMTPDLLPKITLPFDPYLLPPFYATINALTAFVLLLALYFVKNKNIVMHQRMIYLALTFSAMFLVGYVLYHASVEPTRFCKSGAIAYLYYFFLVTHILLSAVIVPFVLFTFIRGYTGQVQNHKKLARWTFPMWLYVAVTGVVCYLMLAPCYG